MGTSGEDLKDGHFFKALLAELIGTFLLVFVACGACLPWDAPYLVPGIGEIALAFGIGVGTIVWGIAHVSGGHINPAVSIGMLVARKISVARFVLYVIAQSVGGIAGALLLKFVTPAAHHGGLGTTLVNGGGGVGVLHGFLIETIITFVLVFTVFATCDSKRPVMYGSGPLAIGLSVTFCHLFAIKFTGSSMNPARSLGPALAMHAWANHWVYWAGPMLGGVLAAMLYEHLFSANASVEKTKALLTSKKYDNEEHEAREAKSHDERARLLEER